VDLEAAHLRFGEREAAFALAPVWRTKLLNGWDDIDLTAQHRETLAAFAADRRAATPWGWPAQAQP
jgi:3-isopropylmalate/(R)-2-methylmalate dehydratase small subunit